MSFKLLRPSMRSEGVYMRPKSRTAAPAPGLFPSRRWILTNNPFDLRKEPGTSSLPMSQRKGDPLYRH